MRRCFFIVGVWICVSILFSSITAQVSLPAVFTDHMVLQQKSDVPVWGWGYAGQQVRIVADWAPQDTVSVKVKPNGTWQTSLKTIGAGGPYTLTVISDREIKVNDVMLGEVWLCSGQSNMEWSAAAGLTNKDAEIAAADYPDIRFLQIPRRGSDTPQDDCNTSWTVCTPQTMPTTSAVAYFFGRKLYKEKNVPVGLIVSAWGGTPAEVWLPKEKVMDNPVLKNNRIEAEFPWGPSFPGTLYNYMIHPVVPYKVAGTIWYQGESNHEKASIYGLLMKSLIESWRDDFGQDMPFYFVQIAPFTYHSKENTPALLREQQEFVSKLIPNTGMVVISDLVDDVKNIHPISKQKVGLRLARMALAETYGENLTDYKSPTYKRMEIKRNKITIYFDNAESGLQCKDKKIEGLMIAGDDGNWLPAEGVIKGNTLVVSGRKLANPKQVRYCFDDATEGNLFTKAGLPVAPFRTDRKISLENE